jgi:hypothetical protein
MSAGDRHHRPSRDLPPGMTEQLEITYSGMAWVGRRPFLTEPEQLDAWPE